MANGTAAPALGELKAFHEMVDILVRNIKDKDQLPFYRDLTQERKREQRKHERELRAARVDGLLNLLAERSMQLTKTQERRLRGKPLAEMPPLKLARSVKDAVDFAVRAGTPSNKIVYYWRLPSRVDARDSARIPFRARRHNPARQRVAHATSEQKHEHRFHAPWCVPAE